MDIQDLLKEGARNGENHVFEKDFKINFFKDMVFLILLFKRIGRLFLGDQLFQSGDLPIVAKFCATGNEGKNGISAP